MVELVNPSSSAGSVTDLKLGATIGAYGDADDAAGLPPEGASSTDMESWGEEEEEEEVDENPPQGSNLYAFLQSTRRPVPR